MFMALPTIKLRLFQRQILFSACHKRTLNMVIRQLRQIQSHAIVLVCCKKWALLGWKLSSDSFDGGTSCANPAVGMRAVLEAGQHSSGESWFLNSWRQWALLNALSCFLFPVCWVLELAVVRRLSAWMAVEEIFCHCLYPCPQAWWRGTGNEKMYLFWDPSTQHEDSLSFPPPLFS